MARVILRYWPALLAPLALAADPSVRVYSEFQRIDPFGAVVSVDRAERPREVLSPALSRNAYATFQIVLTIPEGQPYSLFIGQNPDKAVRVAMYRPEFVRRGDAWIPDGLQTLTMHDTGMVPKSEAQVPGQRVATIWMDLFVAKDAPVRRTRLEVQLNVGDRWIIYPLELRIMSPVAPGDSTPVNTALAAIEAPASETAAAVLRAHLCGNGSAVEEGPITVRSLIRRNARQDVALARELDSKPGKNGVTAAILDRAGVDRKALCEGSAPRNERGAEWFLAFRDLLVRSVSEDNYSNGTRPAGGGKRLAGAAR